MTTIEKMQSTGAAYRLQGVIECFDRKSLSAEELAEMQRLKSDTVMLAGRKISAYVFAVLHLLEIERYSGDDPSVIDLINDMK